MNAESEKMRETFVDQLSIFEARLDSKINDVNMLADIQVAIGHLLSANDGNEAAIRRVLQDRYESGNLRKETFQLVKSMLDRYVTEQLPTSPNTGATSDDSGKDVDLEATMIIPMDARLKARTAEDRVQVGSILRDRFTLQERVAGGSMGVVYKALDQMLVEGNASDPWVAVKVLSPQLAANEQALRALQQEAAKGRCLTHPNIVRFIDLDRDDDLYFIVMEWLDGRTLAEILDAPGCGSLGKARAFQIVQQVGKALDYAHRCGIVHADVKPGNIMMMPNGDLKLFDFGVARVRQKQMQDQSDFDPGVLGLLTPAYSSMQVLTGDDPAPTDDVFSLACLLYRLIAGYRVFGPRNAAEAAEEGMKPQRLQSLSDAQWKVLKKALSYARVTRFDSMAKFMEALDIDSAIATVDIAKVATDVPVSAATKESVGVATKVPVTVATKVPVSVATNDNKGVAVSSAVDVNPGKNQAIKISVPARDDLDLELDPHAPGALRWIVGLVVLLGLLGGAGWKFGLLDEATQRIIAAYPSIAEQLRIADAPSPAIEEEPVKVAADIKESAVDAAATDESSIDETSIASTANNAVTTDAVEIDAAASTELSNDEKSDTGLVPEGELAIHNELVAIEIPVAEVTPLVDFSQLPKPTAELRIAFDGSPPDIANVTLRENGRPVHIDIVRSDVAVPLILRLEEVRFSGNRSPWVTGQFSFTGDGFIRFPVGQDRVRVTLSMASDPLREADQNSTLRIREADNASSELAIINAVLEDDDQRAFEATLPTNTVAFVKSQVSVREQDPVVQIDVVRFNPDNTSMVVGYVLRDITATQGEDYFAPSSHTIEFGRGGRTARILIPLVQDSEYENNEAFSVELTLPGPPVNPDIYHSTAVIIRDDDS
ncbi:MAG: protein kinase [Proteobacteria bacterium]|nr:protein kinase [Pseudomonadota bacterium]